MHILYPSSCKKAAFNRHFALLVLKKLKNEIKLQKYFVCMDKVLIFANRKRTENYLENSKRKFF